MGIKIITDTTSDIPKDIADELDIKILPLKVHFEDTTYLDGVDISHQEFIEKLKKSTKLPNTSQITPSEFIEAYKQEIEKGNSIISIHLSSKISGTYQSAIIAKNTLENADIDVIDSKLISIAYGFPAIVAARMAKQGSTKQDILKKLNYMLPRMEIFFAVNTLEYLKKGGRLSSTKAIIGNMLNIKPIISMKNGEFYVYDKVRGNKKVIPWMLNQVKKSGADLSDTAALIAHDLSETDLNNYIQQIKDKFNPKEIITTNYSSVIATHGGPGINSILFFNKNKEVD